MKTRVLAIADRLSLPALALLAGLNLLFFAIFAMTLVVLAPQARAASDVCNGEDLLPGIAASDPALWQSMQEEAAATPNGQGLLWRIEKDGVAPSFLFGTMHLTDPRVIDLTPQARAAFDDATTVVIETLAVLDQKQASMELMQRPDLMMFTDNTTLTGLLDEEGKALVTAALEERGIPLAAVQKMKPWMLMAMVALPDCEQARKAAGKAFLDIRLASDAKAAGKELAGLESLTDQLGAMAELPMEFHVEGLVETIRLGDRLEDVFETMIVLYEAGNVGMVWPMFRAVMPEGTDEEGYAEFEERMVNARNVKMAGNAVPIIDEGGAFIAVGALHLPGEAGLVELLRARGYTVTRAD